MSIITRAGQRVAGDLAHMFHHEDTAERLWAKAAIELLNKRTLVAVSRAFNIVMSPKHDLDVYDFSCDQAWMDCLEENVRYKNSLLLKAGDRSPKPYLGPALLKANKYYEKTLVRRAEALEKLLEPCNFKIDVRGVFKSCTTFDEAAQKILTAGIQNLQKNSDRLGIDLLVQQHSMKRESGSNSVVISVSFCKSDRSAQPNLG